MVSASQRFLTRLLVVLVLWPAVRHPVISGRQPPGAEAMEAQGGGELSLQQRGGDRHKAKRQSPGEDPAPPPTGPEDKVSPSSTSGPVTSPSGDNSTGGGSDPGLVFPGGSASLTDLVGGLINPGTNDSQPGGSGGAGCSFNVCALSSPCAHGGTCVFNSSTCQMRCLCPAPYDDPDLYDGLCKVRVAPPSTPDPYSGMSTPALRPLEERDCGSGGVFLCWFGVCNTTTANTTTGTGPRRYACDCDVGWSGIACRLPCTLNCSNGGRCYSNGTNGNQTCRCPSPWVGDHCTEKPPPEDTSWKDNLFISMGVLAFLLIALFVVSVYCLWKRRLIVVLRVVYRFLPYEDQDGMRYDAFVSSAEEEVDEHFVYQVLRPRLEEEMGFNLCLSHRDFELGEVISNNIVNGLGSSRRFILVLTPRYLHSKWAQFEYSQALQQMLERKTRIIPIVLEEVDRKAPGLDPTLRTILRSLGAIPFPGPGADERQERRFWKRLRLSLPKKKERGSERTVAGEGGSQDNALMNDSGGSDQHSPAIRMDDINSTAIRMDDIHSPAIHLGDIVLRQQGLPPVMD